MEGVKEEKEGNFWIELLRTYLMLTSVAIQTRWAGLDPGGYL
jgi:hypothetical protein